jgi:hypothetical protein
MAAKFRLWRMSQLDIINFIYVIKVTRRLRQVLRIFSIDTIQSKTRLATILFKHFYLRSLTGMILNQINTNIFLETVQRLENLREDVSLDPQVHINGSTMILSESGARDIRRPAFSWNAFSPQPHLSLRIVLEPLVRTQSTNILGVYSPMEGFQHTCVHMSWTTVSLLIGLQVDRSYLSQSLVPCIGIF